jgi:hypothetical protein
MPELEDVQRNEKLLNFVIERNGKEPHKAFAFISNESDRHDLPWKCRETDCGSRWPTEEELNQHHAVKHETPARLPVECPVRPCPYRSKRQSNLNVHMRMVHGTHQSTELDATWMVRKDELAYEDVLHFPVSPPPLPSLPVPPTAGVSGITDTNNANDVEGHRYESHVNGDGGAF